MADYYVHTSTVIRDLTQRERIWIAREMEFSDDDDVHRIMAGYEGHIDEILGNWPTEFFHWKFQEDGLWLYIEDQGDTTVLARFIQRFLAANRPDTCHQFTWCCTSSRMMVDAFFGGGYFITKDAMREIVPHHELEELEVKHSARQNQNSAQDVESPDGQAVDSGGVHRLAE